MSQAELTLRPPPNVDFVQGYPGIPPGADRPQAAVKGAIEVRVNQQGVKAKWVRIELRKVEVLPGGGQAGTFFDYVGQSPVNLWTATEGDYGILRPQDFPFYIRIPESLPPTIALEKGAGIKYELIATVCIKGKKGFFRRSKSTVLTTASNIIIDKHELHSTWPIYSQLETRTHSQDGVTLTVERGQTCYGPGDRIVVVAMLKSDGLHNNVVLRGFEIYLRETTVFRAGPHTTGKKGAPQVKTSIIAEQKVPVNTTLYGGTHNKTELACTIPSFHTSATINAARHIDITYVLAVKALMGSGLPVVMDLPVIVSNWPRNVSLEAARRIGTTPSLSVVVPHAHPQPAATSQPMSNTYVTRPTTGTTERIAEPPAPRQQYATAPSSTANGYASGPGFRSDEMGYIGQSSHNTISGPHPSASQHGVGQSNPAVGGSSTGRPASAGGSSGGGGSGIPVRSTVSSKFTVTNMADDVVAESPDSPRQAQRSPQPASRTWLSAEEEKRRLYESAKAQVDRVQGVPTQPYTSAPSSQAPGYVDAGPIMGGPGNTTIPWTSAEAEKERLYNKAQEAARRTQGLVSYSPPSTANSGSPPPMSAGAALYQQAMSAVNQASNRGQSASPQNSTARVPVPQYPSGESEKTAVKRYYEAKAAASRSQGQDYASSEPISYDALYPVNNSGSSQAPPDPSIHAPPLANGDSDSPPAFSASGSQHPILSEKERLRRHYEAQDAAMAAVPVSPPPPASLPASPPPAFTPSPGVLGNTTNGFSEKEILRRKFEAEAAAAQTAGRPPAPPPRSLSQSTGSSLPPIPRSPPVPPVFEAPSKPLSAAEEKARLKAQYEAEDARAMSAPVVRPGSQQSNHSLPTPPPLLPRPPVHYIRETQEEDSRTQSKLYNLDSHTPGENYDANFGVRRQDSSRRDGSLSNNL